MHSNKTLQFIASKIMETEAAIFQCLTNSILKIPNSVVHTLQADNDGNIWFFVDRPPQCVSEFEQDFPVNLQYFKKGKPYWVQVSGTAHMLTEAYEIKEDLNLSPEELRNALSTQLLLKVTINKAELKELSHQKKNIIQEVKTFLYSFLDWAEPKAIEYNLSGRSPINYGF